MELKNIWIKCKKRARFIVIALPIFSKLDDASRGDFFESVSKLKYFENVVFQVKPANDPSAEWKNLNTNNALYKEHYEEPLGSLFCMSAFKINPTKKISTFHFDKRFSDFGYGLMTSRQDLFIERLKKTLEKLDFKNCMRLVEYSDLHKYSGTKTLFQKDLKYSWQEELRIILYTNKYKMYDPYEFSIGSIEDISEIFDLRKTSELQYRL